MQSDYTIQAVGNTTVPMALWLLADPSEEQVNKYLPTGLCFAVTQQERIIGGMILSPINTQLVEIKNIAVEPAFQKQGIGTALLKWAEKEARQRDYTKLQIGTGNSSLAQLALYQKMGFEMKEVVANYFTNQYATPIIENGIACKHMVVLVKEL